MKNLRAHQITKDPIPTLSICNIVKTDNENIRIVKHEIDGKNNLGKPHKHDFYLIFFIEKGSGSHFIDFRHYEVHDYQIFFLAPGQVHNWILDRDTSGYQLMFTYDLLRQERFDLFLPYFERKSEPHIKLNYEDFSSVLSVLVSLEAELSSVKDKFSEEISMLKLNLLFKLLQRYHSPTSLIQSDPSYGLLSDFIIDIDKYYKDSSSVRFYAERLHITPNYLSILTRKHLGKSANVIIRERILLEAKRLLASTNLSAKEIAYELGFSDSAYFSKSFKQHTGKTALQFRKEL